MEQIIAFLEKYWGYSLFSGVTIGTIITFIITQIKSIASSSSFKSTVKKIISDVQDQYSEYAKVIDLVKQKATEQLNLYNELIRVRKEQQQANTYYNKVQAAQFKAFSYIIMASKLTEGDKLELLNEFKQLESGIPLEDLSPLEEVEAITSSSIEETITTIETNSNSFDEAVALSLIHI